MPMSLESLQTVRVSQLKIPPLYSFHFSIPFPFPSYPTWPWLALVVYTMV